MNAALEEPRQYNPGEERMETITSRIHSDFRRAGGGRSVVGRYRIQPGVMTYGSTRDSAIAAARALALRVAADCIDHGEAIP